MNHSRNISVTILFQLFLLCSAATRNPHEKNYEFRLCGVGLAFSKFYQCNINEDQMKDHQEENEILISFFSEYSCVSKDETSK